MQNDKIVLQQWVKFRKKAESKGKRLWLVLSGDSVDLLPDAISKPKLSIKLCLIGACTAVFSIVVLSVLGNGTPSRWSTYYIEAKDEHLAKKISEFIVDAMGPNSFNFTRVVEKDTKHTIETLQTPQMRFASTPSDQTTNDSNPNDTSSEKISNDSKTENIRRLTKSQESIKKIKKSDRETLSNSLTEEPRNNIKVNPPKRAHHPKSTKPEDRSKILRNPQLSNSFPVSKVTSGEQSGLTHSSSAPQRHHHVPINPFMSGNVTPVPTPVTEALKISQDDTRRDPFTTNPFSQGNISPVLSGSGMSNIPPQAVVSGFGFNGQNFAMGVMSNITPLGGGLLNAPFGMTNPGGNGAVANTNPFNFPNPNPPVRSGLTRSYTNLV